MVRLWAIPRRTRSVSGPSRPTLASLEALGVTAAELSQYCPWRHGGAGFFFFSLALGRAPLEAIIVGTSTNRDIFF